VTSYGYDAVGNLTRTTDATGAATYSYYDALGRVTAVAAPTRSSTADGTSLTPLTVFRRDAYGNVLVKLDMAKGATAANEASYTAAANADDRSTLSQYDNWGHITQTTDANGVNHYSAYTAQGNLAKEWQAVSGNDGVTKTLFHAYQYDKLGRQTHQLDPASTSVLQGGLYTSVNSSSVPATNESGQITLSGTNSITLNWAGLTDVSGGLVRVQVDYQTVSTRSLIGYDEGGVPVYSGIASHAATRTQDFGANAASAGVALAWSDAGATDGGLSQLSYIRVWQQDAAGNWISKWQGSAAQANGSGLATVSQAQAGMNDTALEYNAFGEVTRKGVNGGRQEYFNYDNAGHLWRSNSGDGIDKVSLYDTLGHQTAAIQSAGVGRSNLNLLTYASADQIAGLTDVRRTDIRYDALGHVVQKSDPERLQLQGGVNVRRGYSFVQIAATSKVVLTFNESGAYASSWSGTNAVNLSWASLSNLGSGDVKW